jgi:hypothetical protein
MASGDLISAAAILVGFGVTVFMFRIQRELYVLEVLKVQRLWLAWADYLTLASVALAVFGVIVPLLALPASARSFKISSAFCVSAFVLQAGYIPAVLAHYRIDLGASRAGPRSRGEPLERVAVIVSAVIALLTFLLVIRVRASS